MKSQNITSENIDSFKRNLENDEKSKLTVKKYVRDVLIFGTFLENSPITKENVISYKNKLINQGYSKRSINSVIASINSFCDFLEIPECKVKTIKIQNQIFDFEEKQLTKSEFKRLVITAENENNPRLSLILQTLFTTGIRISELQFITAESVINNKTVVTLKGKTRNIFITEELRKKLIRYMNLKKIETGPVFITKSGKQVDRSNIWREMKKLCEKANVNPQKVFPHNIRHLFARIFYSIGKDIVKLADILGHSSINTTRIYTKTTVAEYQKLIENMYLRI